MVLSPLRFAPLLIGIALGISGCDKPKTTPSAPLPPSASTETQSAAPTATARAETLEVTDTDFVRLSGPIDPSVAYAIGLKENQLEVWIEVARPAGAPAVVPQVELAVASQKSVRLDSAKARAIPKEDTIRYVFTIDRRALLDAPIGWGDLRFATRVSWIDPQLPVPRLIQRFRDSGIGAAFDPISADSNQWELLDLGAYIAGANARKNQIAIEFAQPVNGRASIVVDSAAGSRVRNLVNGADFAAGTQRVVWDGLDDNGRPVDPGTYNWRAVTHAGIQPNYLFSFDNPGTPPYGRGTKGSNWGGDHSDPMAATAFENDIYIGWPVAESGNNIILVDPSGTKQGDYNIPAHAGGQLLMLAANANRVYAVVEGRPWYDAFKQETPNGPWTCRRPTSILSWTREGQVVRFSGPRGEQTIAENLVDGTGPIPKWVAPPDNLRGVALVDNRLFVSLNKENRIAIFSADNAKPSGEIKVPNPGLLAPMKDGKLLVLSGKTLGIADPASGEFKPLGPVTVAEPRGMAVSDAGEIFISDNGPDQNIKVFSTAGKLVRTVGKKGGRPNHGAWDSSGVFEPYGIAIDATNQLWVAENDTTPRRISVWDAPSGALRNELFGPTHYGAPGASFDPQDLSRWIGEGVLWNVDFATQTAKPVSTLFRKPGPASPVREMEDALYHFVQKDGRTFLIGQSKQITIYELTKDLKAKPLVLIGSLMQMANSVRWTLPAPIAQMPIVKAALEKSAVNRKIDPATLFVPSERNPDWVEIPQEVLQEANKHFLWTDRNGDGLAEESEFQFLPDGTPWQIGYWGTGQLSLDLELLVGPPEKPQLLHLNPAGFLPSGAPDYPLAEALTKAIDLPVPSPKNLSALTTDSQQRLLLNATPMTAYTKDGTVAWTMINNYPSVHASQKAPLPKRGEMQGPLYFLGSAPFDEEGDITIINGNHGRFFVLTTDGIYVDELFSDIRVLREAGPYLIGGECFGGFFGKAEKDGKYYLQSGHTDYRIFEILGIDGIKRSNGTLTVSTEQAAAAAAEAQARQPADTVAKEVTVADLKAGAPAGNDPEKWPGKWQVTWGDKDSAYPFAEVKIVRQGDRLLLAWRVKDPSPWVNNGKDWMQLFKSGDLVAFEYSTDPSAAETRAKAASGDRRLFIAPFEGKPMAVLYDYVNPKGDPISFSSPWRSEKIDRVTQLTDAQIEVQPGAAGYTVIANLPTAELGLPASGTAANLKGDFGVIYGDAAGTINLLRSYWSNRETGLVNDVPGEAAIQPKNWGKLIFP